MIYAASAAFAGVFAVSVSIWLLATFKRRFNYDGYKGLARSAYCVYLIHPFVIDPCIGLVIAAYRALGNEVRFAIDERGGWGYSCSPLGTTELVCGYLCAAVASQALVWPLAGWFRRLPLVRHVL